MAAPQRERTGEQGCPRAACGLGAQGVERDGGECAVEEPHPRRLTGRYSCGSDGCVGGEPPLLAVVHQARQRPCGARSSVIDRERIVASASAGDTADAPGAPGHLVVARCGDCGGIGRIGERGDGGSPAAIDRRQSCVPAAG